jgi:DNA-binding transcriptional MerR regulator
VKIQEAIEKLHEETGLHISRPKIYHYDREGVFGSMNRLENGYRDIDNVEYFKMKVAILLCELGCDIRQIKAVLNKELDCREVLVSKSNVIRLLNTLI